MAPFLAKLAEILTPIGWGAVAAVVAGWLAVSFLPAGRPRAVLESLSATGLFAALLALFANLVDDAVREQSRIRTAAFGILLALFSCSFVLSCVLTVRAAIDSKRGPASSTN